jgi:phage shock protein PspC (stress-responsive transcriptional regulator)
MPTTTYPQGDLHDNSLAGARDWFERKGLTRPREGRVLGGVSASFARRYDVNPLVARLLTIVTIAVLTPLVYIAAWLLMPEDSAAPAVMSAA